jgi:CRP-like cAMP-binding protein
MDQHEPILKSYFEHLRSHLPVSAEAEKLVTSVVITGLLKKGEFSLVEGKTCNHIDFIHKGVLRSFSSKDGLEITTGIYLENICVTSMKSLSAKSPSTLSIQAVEDVYYARIKGEDLQRMYSLSSELQNIGRAILESMVIEENDWKEMYTLYDPEERYLFLLKKSPAMLQRVPLQHVASFLGIRRETLSRIRSRTIRER